MRNPQSEEEAREAFAAYVRETVRDPAETAATTGASSRLSLPHLDLYVAAGVLALLFVVLNWASGADHRRHDSILAEHRYSIGESDLYRWRYDGLDNGLYDRQRNLSTFDRMRLRRTGLHVTYDEYRAHRALRSVRMASGLLFFIDLLVAGRFVWRKTMSDGWRESVESVEAVPPAIPPRRSGRPVFGRRAG